MADDPLIVARDAIAGLAAHEKVCAERYDNINKTLDELKAIMKWAGGLVITLLLAVLAWALTQVWEANEAEKKALEEQIKLIQRLDSIPTPPSAPAASSRR